MKPKQLLLISVFGNVALSGLCIYLLSERGPNRELGKPSAENDRVPRVEKNEITGEQESLGNGKAGAEAPVEGWSWDSIESPSYKEYIANLRRVGCPEKTIRDIVLRDLQEHYEGKKLEILASATRNDYWSPDFEQSSLLVEQHLTAIKELDASFNSVHKELLGMGPEEKHGLKNLTTEEREVLGKYGALEAETFRKVRDITADKRAEWSWLAPGAEKRAEVAQAAEQRVKAALGPERWEEYQMRSSVLARQLRSALGSFHPSREEFESAYRLLRNMKATDEANASVEEVAEALRYGMSPQRWREFESASRGR